MNRKFKDALKDAYGFPQPQRKEDFFNTLTINEKKSKPVPISTLRLKSMPSEMV